MSLRLSTFITTVACTLSACEGGTERFSPTDPATFGEPEGETDSPLEEDLGLDFTGLDQEFGPGSVIPLAARLENRSKDKTMIVHPGDAVMRWRTQLFGPPTGMEPGDPELDTLTTTGSDPIVLAPGESVTIEIPDGAVRVADEGEPKLRSCTWDLEVEVSGPGGEDKKLLNFESQPFFIRSGADAGPNNGY